jgi:hypothetical protein
LRRNFSENLSQNSAFFFFRAFFRFFQRFSCQIKANGFPTPYIGYCRRKIVMRKPRKLAEHVWHKVETAVMLVSSVAYSLPPYRGAVFKQRSQCFGCGCWVGVCLGGPVLVGDFGGVAAAGGGAVDWRPAVTLFSSMAYSLPLHRGAVFKQRPHRFGRGFEWGGGDG